MLARSNCFIYPQTPTTLLMVCSQDQIVLFTPKPLPPFSWYARKIKLFYLPPNPYHPSHGMLARSNCFIYPQTPTTLLMVCLQDQIVLFTPKPLPPFSWYACKIKLFYLPPNPYHPSHGMLARSNCFIYPQT